MVARAKPPIPPGVDQATRAWMAAVIESLEEGEGRRGRPDDRWLRESDLISIGLARRISNGGIGPGTLVPTFPAPDATKPPTATGLEVTGLFTTILVRWDNANRAYRTHALTEIWRSVTDDRATAVQVGQTIDSIFADDNVTYGVTYYYWIRWASENGEVGMWNGVAGTPGQLSENPAELLERLQGQITETELFSTLNTRLDKIETNETAIEVAQVIIDGHSAQYTVKIDNNGYVAGYGLASEPIDGQIRSIFLVNADTFAISNPSVSRKSVSSLTRSGTTATASSSSHGFTVGQKIVISGSTSPGWNGSWTVATVPNANTFTFSVPSGLTGTAQGTKYAASGSIPFIVDSGSVIIDVAFIKDASITNAKVQNLGVEKLIGDLGEFVVANIGTGTITSAMIDVIIQSTVYVAESVGWAIHKSGWAEFSNIYARGDIEASSLKVDAADIVSTLNIAGNSVTSMHYKESALDVTTSSSSYSALITSDAMVQKAGMTGFVVHGVVAYTANTSGTRAEVDIVRNGSTVIGGHVGANISNGNTVTLSVLGFDDNPGSNPTYSLRGRSFESNEIRFRIPRITVTGGYR